MVEQIGSDSERLREIVSPQRATLLVVDVQNDFCHERGAFGRRGIDLGAIQQSVETLLGLIDTARKVSLPVIFIKTHHDRWTNSSTWLSRGPRASGEEICATGSWGAEFYRVQPAPGERVVVKHRYSGFYMTELEMVLRVLGRQSVLVTGVASNVCVESTAREAFMRDYHVVLVEDCAGAATKEEHEAACANIRGYFGRVLDSQNLVALWRCRGDRTV